MCLSGSSSTFLSTFPARFLNSHLTLLSIFNQNISPPVFAAKNAFDPKDG
jgi:hypothetical protein